MADPDPTLRPVSPARVLREIASAVPPQCRANIIIVGSLAVGYHYFGDRKEMVVRTKDADCLLSPRVHAVDAGVSITEQLLDAAWQLKEGEWGAPGDADTPNAELPAVRLRPPGAGEWFIELLTVPDVHNPDRDRWLRLETKHGHFGLHTFKFLALANHKPIQTRLGVHVARPEMMALANLLEHPAIGPETMSAGFAGRPEIKRSNKDLGRVIAIARLATSADEDALLSWPSAWIDALRACFPRERKELAARCGSGLEALLSSEPDLEQAWFTCVNGLLASIPPSLDEFSVAGQRVLQDAVAPLQRL